MTQRLKSDEDRYVTRCRMRAHPQQAWPGGGRHGVGSLRVILHINSRLAREMGMTLTHDVTGRQLPWLQPLCKSLEMVRSMPWDHACPLTRAAKKGREYGVRADVADCGRSWKWGYRGRSAPGFKPRRSSHSGA